ncbi:MAG: tetratricopeptide repeat protein, partial [Chloroflexi bacterium]|nr:tetratricopeptide repeat protein [Chloroflexota bacterium]
IVVFIKTPEWLRPVILLPLVVFRDFVAYTLNGVQDIVWSLALIGVIITWKRPTVRALLFGAACTFRQQPWFAAPFLLIYLWQEGGSRRERLGRTAYFAGISALFFIVVNLPFVIWDPDAWLRGAVEPSYAAFNFMSQSLGALTQYGIAPFPRLFYSALQFSSLLIMVILYWCYARPIGQAFWIFPSIFFWLYYRGLANYWMYWLPVLLVAITYRLDGRFSLPALSTNHRTRYAIPLVLVSTIVLANAGLAAYYLRQSPPVSMAYVPPVEVIFGGRVNRLTLTVTNDSSRLFTPRFAVQPETSIQAWPWHIDSGPERLRPGQTGQYVISAQESTFKAFQVGWGGQVVVSDAGGDYNLRAVLTIPKQTHAVNPDLIANPDYRYWPQDGSAPLNWVLDADTGSVATLVLVSQAGRSALKLHMESNPNAEVRPVVRMAQTISFPDRFTVWVYPTTTSTDPADEIYGLEVTDGVHQLWILFGPHVETQADQPQIIVIPAPLNQWSRQVVDLATLYQSIGWTIPLPSTRYEKGLRYTVPQVRLSWIAASRSRNVTSWFFSPIEQETGRYEPESLVANALKHPDNYYITLGDQQRSQRNHPLAQDFYRKALAENPSNSAAHFGLAENYFWSGEWDRAAASFGDAISYGYPIPGLAYKGIGWAQYNLMHYEEGAATFEQSIQWLTAGAGSDHDSRLADAYSGLGWSQLRLQNCEQAIIAFETALTLDKDHPTARGGLRECQGSE